MSTKSKSQKVVIERRCDSWFVMYSDRAIRQRRACACFNVMDHSRASVVRFIQQNRRLELTNPHP